MIDKTSQAAGIADMLAQIRAYQTQVQSKVAQPPVPASLSGPTMGQMIESATQSMFNTAAAKSASPTIAPVTRAPEGYVDPNSTAGPSLPLPEVRKPSFGEVVRNSIESVNDLQMRSSAQRTAYEKGEDIPLTDVVLGMQKASLAFEATLQIRNKVLKAYEDVLNMPV
jgi:flagellar hook-basal body complex protein FliE